MSNSIRGKFLWYELLTEGHEKAIDFYTKLVGWSTVPWGEGEDPYTMWMNGESPVGGVMELPEEAKAEGAPPHWLGYIGTPDLDAAMARVKELGGAVHMGPMDLPEVGRIAIVADPQGATFSLYTPAGDPPPGHDGPPKLGEVAWHELMAVDWETVFDFYSDLFGWEKKDAVDIGEMGTYLLFGQGEAVVGGMFNKPADMPVPAWFYYFQVEDIHASAEKVKELGGQIVTNPMEVPGGTWIAQGIDPTGAFFSLHSGQASTT